MGLKPDPHTAILVQERVKEAMNRAGLDAHEQQALEAFDQDIDRYLE